MWGFKKREPKHSLGQHAHVPLAKSDSLVDQVGASDQITPEKYPRRCIATGSEDQCLAIFGVLLASPNRGKIIG